MPPLTIVHQVDLRSSRSLGGIDTFVRDFVGLAGDVPLRVLGCAWVGASGAEPGAVVRPNVTFHQVARLREARGAVPDSLRMAWGVFRNRRSLGPVVHVHRIDYVPLVRVLRPRASVVLHVHTDAMSALGPSTDSRWRHVRLPYLLFERLALRWADRVRTFARSDLERLRRIRPDAELCTAWFNDGHFFPGPDWDSRDDLVLWAGRFEPPKDPLLALDAFHAASRDGLSARLVVVGAGSLEPEIRGRVQALGLQDAVDVMPPLPADALAQLLRRSRAVLQTSRFEGAPRLLVEALACGTPVVSTAAGDPEGLLRGGDAGAAVPGRRPEDLGAALQAVLAARRLADPGAVADRRGRSFVAKVLSADLGLPSRSAGRTRS